MIRDMTRWLRYGLVAALLIGAVNAFAAPFPSKPLTIVVPYGPGGAGDLTTRVFAKEFTKTFKVPVVVLNRPGPGFVNSATLVAHADPDGYTAFLSGNGMILSSLLFKSLAYKMSQFKNVSTLAFFDLVLLVNKGSPFKTVHQVLAWAKAHPDRLTIATVSAGSTQNLAAHMFESLGHIKAQIIPFTSTAEVLTALRGNQVQAAFEIMPPVFGQVQAGALKALAVTSSQRFAGLPDVPTMSQAGLRGFEATSWSGVSLPARTPDAIVERLSNDMAVVLAKPAVQRAMRKLGAVASSTTPAEMDVRVREDTAKWSRVIDEAHIPRH